MAVSLLPVAQLNIPVPPLIAQIGAQMSPGQSSASAQASASVGLPGFSISASLAAQIAAAINAAAQISAAFGVNLMAPGASASLAAIIGSFNFDMRLLLPQLPVVNLSAVASLSAALSMIATLRASLGIDLLAPQVAVNLQAALALGLPGLAAAASAQASASASAQLAAAASLVGGFGSLFPVISILAQLQLPSIYGPGLMALLNFNAMQTASLNLQAVLGLSASADMAIRLALQPLSLIGSLSLQAAASAPIAGASASASASAAASATASMNLSAFANLPIPNLAPLAFVANFALQNNLISASSCHPSCPLA